MKKLYIFAFSVIVVSMIVSCVQKAGVQEKQKVSDVVATVVKAEILNPADAVNELAAGNKRFLEGKLINIDYKKEIDATKGGQKPHSVILSCMDSRVPPEIIFDQGIGNIFVIRVAGNIEDDNVLGSIEYAIEHSGSKLVLVMGHSHCGAVTGAVKNVMLGNLTQLVDQIKPAIKSDPADPKTIDETAINNIRITIDDILNKSEVVKEFVQEKKVEIKGAFYDIETGKVTFLE